MNNGGGIVLPNLGSQSSSTHPTGQAATFLNIQQQQAMQVSLTQLRATTEHNRNQTNMSQSPNIKKDTSKLKTASNVVQVNASEFNLRLTNNSKLSQSGKGHHQNLAVPFQ